MAFGGGKSVLRLAGAVVVQYVLPVGNPRDSGDLPGKYCGRITAAFPLFPRLHGYRNNQVIAGQHRIFGDPLSQHVPAESAKVQACRRLHGQHAGTGGSGVFCQNRGTVIGQTCAAEAVPQQLSAKGTKCVCRFRSHFLPAGFAEVFPPRNRTVTAGAAIGIEQIQQKHLHFSAGGYGNGHGFTSDRALCRVAFHVTFIVYHIEVKIANMTVDL